MFPCIPLQVQVKMVGKIKIEIKLILKLIVAMTITTTMHDNAIPKSILKANDNINGDDNVSANVNAIAINHQSTEQNLGVTFDQTMSFDDQISKICKSSHYHLRNIGKIRKYLDESFTETLIHAFVTSKLDYCNALLNGLPKYQTNRLRLVPSNTAARVVTRTHKYEHITPVLIGLHWLPISYRITFKILLLTYKALNNLAPSYLSDLLSQRCNVRLLRSRSQELLSIPRSRTVMSYLLHYARLPI